MNVSIKKERNKQCGQLFCLLLCGFFWLLAGGRYGIAAEDPRAYQHGINLVPISNGAYQLVWSSSGNPPTGPDGGDWTHDVYYTTIKPDAPSVDPAVNAMCLISRYEAQEPASAAIAQDGHIMITMEDGYEAPNEVAQRFGVYGEHFTENPMPYDDINTTVHEGGHSGHVAAVGNRFVVFWSDGWDNSVPGADGIGTGEDVLLDVYDSTGNHLEHKDISVDNDTNAWWPVVAGSSTAACLVWQQYVEGDQYCDLMYAIYDPDSNQYIKANARLETEIQYYTYDVQYIEGIDRFLVYATYYDGGGCAFLLDAVGNMAAQLKTLPAGVREAQPAIKNHDNGALAVYPISSQGLLSLSLKPDAISIHETIQHDYVWSSIGCDGVFLDDSTIYVAALSVDGLRAFVVPVKPFDDNPQPPENNLALNKPVYVSSIDGKGMEGGRAVDGDRETRWASREGIDPQLLILDLKNVHHINRINVVWDAGAEKYAILAARNFLNWQIVARESDGIPEGEVEFDTDVEARYILVFGLKRATECGYSISELEVFGYMGCGYGSTER